MTAPCDTLIASTMAVPAAQRAWSDCDDPFMQECDTDLYDDVDENEPSRWRWAFVITAWAAATPRWLKVSGPWVHGPRQPRWSAANGASCALRGLGEQLMAQVVSDPVAVALL